MIFLIVVSNKAKSKFIWGVVLIVKIIIISFRNHTPRLAYASPIVNRSYSIRIFCSNWNEMDKYGTNISVYSLGVLHVRYTIISALPADQRQPTQSPRFFWVSRCTIAFGISRTNACITNRASPARCDGSLVCLAAWSSTPNLSWDTCASPFARRSHWSICFVGTISRSPLSSKLCRPFGSLANSLGSQNNV